MAAKTKIKVGQADGEVTVRRAGRRVDTFRVTDGHISVDGDDAAAVARLIPGATLADEPKATATTA